MRIFFTILAVQFIFLTAQSQELPGSFLGNNSYFARSNKAVTKRVDHKIKRDAARLVLRMGARGEALRFQPVEIPQELSNEIYNVLINLYTHNETVRSITRCNVHTFPNPALDYFILEYDKNVAWGELLAMDILDVEDDRITHLLENYNLSIADRQRWTDDTDAITIRSKKPINIEAVANEFYNIEGVKSIDLGLPEIEGNDIQVERIENAWKVSYVLRFGHTSGLDSQEHIWTFTVNDNQEIKFESESGAPVPEWMKCDAPVAVSTSF